MANFALTPLKSVDSKEKNDMSLFHFDWDRILWSKSLQLERNKNENGFDAHNEISSFASDSRDHLKQNIFSSSHRISISASEGW